MNRFEEHPQHACSSAKRRLAFSSPAARVALLALACLAPAILACAAPTSAEELQGSASDAGSISVSEAPAGGIADAITTTGLSPVDDAQIVYDADQGVYWLANANLAATLKLGVDGINDSGSMTYQAALAWVDALNRYDNDAGYLGHPNWQLPTTPPKDPTCSKWSGNQGNSFGSGCTGSALGYLFYEGMNETYPNTVAPVKSNTVGDFQDVQPSLYWTTYTEPDGEGQETLSFSNGMHGANTVPNYLYVWPRVHHAIGEPLEDGGLQLCCDGGAVYDPNTHSTWLVDANLAASEKFGITGKDDGGVALINRDGSMQYETAAADGGWIDAMNAAAYLGQTDWQLPADSTDLQTLYADMGLTTGDSVLTTTESVGPFQNIQPYLYWSCEREQDGGSGSPCLVTGPGPGYEWSLNFGSGFQGTDLDTKELYVMVYYPAPPPPPPYCKTLEGCCLAQGGVWLDGQCL